MNYRFLAKEEITKFFKDTDLSVGEIIFTILKEKYTQINISNRSKILDMSDETWYKVIEKTFADFSEEDTDLSDEEFDSIIHKMVDRK